MENVRVPKENVIGEVNRGWYAMATTLDFERSGIQGVARLRRDLEELTGYVRAARTNGALGRTHAAVRHALTERVIENEAGRMLSYRVVDMQARKLIPNHEASAAKLFNAELSQRVANTGIRILGLYGQIPPESPWAKLRGHFERTYLGSVAASIAGGTNEIQRNILATRGLGLPRG
jgi:alkylation response protein AidB-like acyl-CoA dehydrogenase